jgi:hypothetical protein
LTAATGLVTVDTARAVVVVLVDVDAAADDDDAAVDGLFFAADGGGCRDGITNEVAVKVHRHSWESQQR